MESSEYNELEQRVMQMIDNYVTTHRRSEEMTPLDQKVKVLGHMADFLSRKKIAYEGGDISRIRAQA